MNLYFAAGSLDLDRAKRWMARARQHGHAITHDWTESFTRAAAQGYQSDADLPHADRVRIATEDYEAITAADVVWLLAPTTPSKGVWTELGLALACRDFYDAPGAVICSGPGAPLFCALADRCFESDELAAEWVAVGGRG